MLFFIRNNAHGILGFVCILFIGGLLLIPGLPVAPVPDISPQQVMVTVTAPGLAAQEVERLITFPLESSLTGIPGVENLRSISRTGVSAVYLQFADQMDIDLARERVSQRLVAALNVISIPGVSIQMGPLATGMGEIMQVQIKGKGYGLPDLNRLMTWTVVPRLKQVPGVVDVNVNGGAEEVFQLTVDPAQLVLHGVSLPDITTAINANNASAGGGWIAAGNEQRIVVGRARVMSLVDMGEIPVKLGQNGNVVRVRDLGKVEMGTRTRLGAVTRDGQGEIVNGVVLMQNGASANATLASIQAALPEIEKMLPTGVTLDPFYTRAKLTTETINTVKENLFFGAALVLIVLWAVLGEMRAALVIISVIPMALVSALVGMRYFGVSANLLSLGAIDFGMIVDGSLVVVEHILARRAQVESRAELTTLAHKAMADVIKPVSFAISMIVLVYLPILTLQGIEGKMFRPMAETVILGLLASLAYCVCCVPALSAKILRYGVQDVETRIMTTLRRAYRPALHWCSRRSRFILGATVGCFVLSVGMALHLGGEFVPQLDEGALLVTSLRLPRASLDTVIKGVTTQERILRTFPEVETVVSNTGTSAIPTDPMGTAETDSFIFLKPRNMWKTAQTEAGLVEKMNAALQDQLPDASYSWTQPIQMRMDDLLAGVRTQLAVAISGSDLEKLNQLAAQLAATLRGVPGAADVAVVSEGTLPFMHIDINRDAAARLGVQAADILATVEAIGGRVGFLVTTEDAIIPTQVRFAPQAVHTMEDIRRLRVRRFDGAGWVLLGDVTHINVEEGPSRIDRDGLQRRVIVQANVRGRDIASFVASARRAVSAHVSMPAGYIVSWNGAFRNLESASKRLAIVVPVALILMFGLLVLALSSVKSSLLVFCNLPIAVMGGIVALTLRGMPFSIAAGVGFVALLGVAVLNGVVLMSRIHQYRDDGLSAVDAALKAAHDRLRPVIATAAVASFGFVPMAFSGSAGAEVDRPLATVVIGGLISSTLLTMFVLPTFYAMLHRNVCPIRSCA